MSWLVLKMPHLIDQARIPLYFSTEKLEGIPNSFLKYLHLFEKKSIFYSINGLLIICKRNMIHFGIVLHNFSDCKSQQLK